MVQQGDFEIKLVEAESKTPFIEHSKEGKTYVECEPGAEYFIEVLRTGSVHDGRCYLKFFVDNQDLGFHYTVGTTQASPSYQGLWSRANGVTTTKALKFTKPKVNQYDEYTGLSNLLMGKVEVKVYEAVYKGMKERSQRNVFSSFSAATVGMGQGGDVKKKKNLRSDHGSAVVVKEKKQGMKKKYKKGALLETITLNYCAALGLMEVGVLPKPDMWTEHRMKRPAEPSNADAVQPKKVRDAASGKEVEVFDLVGDD